MDRIASGIAGFDPIVQGGLPAETSLVLQGPPGQEKLAFALAFLAEGLRNGGSGLFVVASQSPESLLRDLRRFGVDVERVVKEDRLRIVDWFSWGEETVTDVEERGVVVRSSVDLTNAGVAVSRGIAALRGDGPRRAVVEMLSPAMNVYEVGQVYAFAQSTKRKFDRFHFTALFLLENEMHTAAVLTTLHQPFDGVIEIERSRSGDRIVRKIGVLHLKDTAPVSDFIPFEFTDQGIRVGPPAPPRAPRTVPPAVHVTPPPVEPPESRRPSELRASRIGLIQEIARERLRIDPEDRDALFTLAAAQTVADNPRAAIRTLERLETIDPDYPGLWAFEMKLFARLGNAERWRRSRQKALQASAESEGVGAGPCPFCKAPVAAGSAQCPHCMADLREETDLFRGLEDLVRATVQEMVQDERGAKPLAPVPAPHPRPVPRTPALRPVPKAKGLTNGLVLERRPLRPIAVSKAGRVNGLRGRTNGLTNGLRGRTNGLTNGLGHTNGLTNGLRGRTNGLTNGLGRTNGLTNGLGSAAQKRGFLGRRSAPRWQRVLLPAAIVALLLLLPLALFWTGPTPSYPIQIDGQFVDWSGVSQITAPPPAQLTPDIDITRVAVRDNVDYTAFYLEVAGDPLAGGPAPQRITNTFYAFIDTDRSTATGYRVQGLGADRMIRVDTWGGGPVGASLFEFDGTRSPQDWNGWIRVGPVSAAGSGNRLEFEARRIDLGAADARMEVAFASRGWNGESDAADVVATDASSFLLVSQDTAAPNVLRTAGDVLARFTLTAMGGSMAVTSLNVSFQGTFGPNSFSVVDLFDPAGLLLSEQAPGPFVHFPLGSYVVPANTTQTLTLHATVINSDGSTVGAFVAVPEDVQVAAGGVGMVSPVRGAESLAYVGGAPSGVRIDGGFVDWSNVTSDPVSDVRPVWDSDIDLSAYSFQGYAGSAYFSAQVVGRVLNGTLVPALNPAYTPPGNGSSNGTVGPRPPPVNGTDDLLFYLDEDGSTATGYGVGGLGADYLVQIAGKGGDIFSSQALRFNGTSSREWRWTALGTAAAAKDGSRIEAALSGVPTTNVSRAFFEARGWNNALDSSLAPSGPTVLSATALVAASTRSPTTVSPAVRPGRLVARDLPGNQRWFFTNTASNGTGCTSNLAASTTAGSSPASTDLTGTGSICWFTPVGQPASTPAGTWELYFDVASKVNGSTALHPNANGAVNQWTSSSTGACRNNQWQCVKEDPNDGDTTYISSTSASVLDSLFTLAGWTPAPPSPLSILNVTVEATCKYVAGTGDVRVSVRVGTTIYPGGSHSACSSASYTTFTNSWATNPSNGSAWFLSDLSNLQIGARDADASTSEVRVSSLRALVYFKPIYSLEVDLCTASDCATPTPLYGPVNSNVYGDDILKTASIGSQSLTSGQRIRFRVALVLGGTVTLRYNGPNPGTSDSRSTVPVPIPEFQEILLPLGSTLVLIVVARRRRDRRVHREKNAREGRAA